MHQAATHGAHPNLKIQATHTARAPSHLSATIYFCGRFEKRQLQSRLLFRSSHSPGLTDPTVTSEFGGTFGVLGVLGFLGVCDVRRDCRSNRRDLPLLRRPTAADSTVAGFRGTRTDSTAAGFRGMRTASLAARLASP
mmetsp:Transcript_87724/g.263778  ORF Transcript_87724/g.263778 Transcript_87724/m.263778 type:complete len:138 (+) Transcript_87724:38-451(+)|eukprot:305034-Prymnesium_polylepis.2